MENKLSDNKFGQRKREAIVTEEQFKKWLNDRWRKALKAASERQRELEEAGGHDTTPGLYPKI